MNQTSSDGSLPSAGADLTGLLTSIHLVWLAVFAGLVVVAILYGMRLARRRRRAERDVVSHAREAEATPVVADAPLAEAPGDAAPPPPAPAPVGDDGGPVTQLKGLGPKVAARLAELGVSTVGQIAALDHDAAVALDAQLGPFAGRMERDRWVEQARFLAAGDRAGFEAVFGRL